MTQQNGFHNALQGVLDQRGRRTLSKLIYFVFTPALTFSKLAPVLTVQHLLLWMPLAINMFFRYVIEHRLWWAALIIDR